MAKLSDPPASDTLTDEVTWDAEEKSWVHTKELQSEGDVHMRATVKVQRAERIKDEIKQLTVHDSI